MDQHVVGKKELSMTVFVTQILKHQYLKGVKF